MEFSLEFIGLIIAIYVIITLLNIILFFKVWGMTNDTAKIKDILQEWLDLEHPVIEDEKDIKKK